MINFYYKTLVFILFIGKTESLIGSSCDQNQGDYNNPTCGPNELCWQSLCRNGRCTVDSQCQINEECRGGCYPKSNTGSTNNSMKCIDGSDAVVFNANNGQQLPMGCDLNNGSACPSNSRCLATQQDSTIGQCCNYPQANGQSQCPSGSTPESGSARPCTSSSNCNVNAFCALQPNTGSGICCQGPICTSGQPAYIDPLLNSPTQCQQDCDCIPGWICQSIGSSNSFCCPGISNDVSCTSNPQCSGTTCKNGRCCSSGVPNALCMDGSAPNGTCIAGLCSVGHTCKLPENICCSVCPNKGIAYMINGQPSMCTGINNNVCPSGFRCQRSPSNNNMSYCCAEGISQPSIGTCPNNNTPQLTYNGQPQTCSPTSPQSCYNGYSCQFTGSDYVCCQDSAGGLGYACISGRYCNDRSAVCLQGICKCNSGYEQTIDGRYCVPLPALGQRCDGCDSFSACYKCSDENAKCACTYTGCFCECDQDKGYYNDVNKCSRSIVQLDVSCTKDQECIQAYAYCASGKCACRTGFTKETTGDQTICKPNAMNCPFEVPLAVDSKVVECTKQQTYNYQNYNTSLPLQPSPIGYPCALDENILDKYDDDCPDNYYCNVYDEDMLQSPANLKSKGFCCKMHEPKCPVGSAHASSVSPNFGCSSCPTETHYCHADGKTSPREICCPKGCHVTTDVTKNGKCYPMSFYLGSCQVNEQCQNIGLDVKCVTINNEQVCACSPGFVLQYGRCVEAKCNYGSEPFKLNGIIARCGAFSPPYSILSSSNPSNLAQACPENVFQCATDLNICCKKACPISNMIERYTPSKCTSDSYCVNMLPYANAYQLRCNTDTGVCCELSNVYIPPNQPLNPPPNVNPSAMAGELGGPCISGQYCNRLTVCKNGYCQCDLGFVPSYDNRYCERLPKLGERCENLFTCQGDYVTCSCETYPNCVCQCMQQDGYFADNGICVRKNVALDAPCTNNVDCQAAYSECAASICACKADFTKSTDVCTAAAQNCPIDVPLMQDSKVFTCTLTPKLTSFQYNPARDSLNKNNITIRFKRQVSNANCIPATEYEDNCPDGYYCVPEGDEGSTGFCCKHQDPKCPVGEIHASSTAPLFGCSSCPTSTHYCHADKFSNAYEICCPKACYATGDIISEGKCYARVEYDQQCQVNEQCTSLYGASLQCLQFGTIKKCACPQGYVFTNSQCTKVYCPFGGKPVEDSNGYTLRCAASYQYNISMEQQVNQCPYGYECSGQYSVCCLSQCPPNMTAVTGLRCTYDYECYRGIYSSNNRYICNSSTRSCCNIQQYSFSQARRTFGQIRKV